MKPNEAIQSTFSSLASKYGKSMLVREMTVYRKQKRSVEFPNYRIKLSPAQRSKIYERQDAVCRICVEYMAFHDMEIDHIQSLASGGKNEMKNYQGVHRHCNREKSSKSLSQIAKEQNKTILEQLK